MSGLNSKRCKFCQTLYQSPMKSSNANDLMMLTILPLEMAKDRRAIGRWNGNGQ